MIALENELLQFKIYIMYLKNKGPEILESFGMIVKDIYHPRLCK